MVAGIAETNGSGLKVGRHSAAVGGHGTQPLKPSAYQLPSRTYPLHNNKKKDPLHGSYGDQEKRQSQTTTAR